MTDRAAAIAGVFADYRLIKTRGVLALVIEVPVERQAEVFAALGYPMPGEEQPVAVARLANDAAQEAEEKPLVGRPPPPSDPAPQIVNCNLRDPMKAAVQRAFWLCRDPRFQEWLYGRPPRRPIRREGGEGSTEMDAADYLRQACGVDSRAEIAADCDAYERFLALEARYKADTGQMAEQRG